jgi:hypothetical protein
LLPERKALFKTEASAFQEEPELHAARVAEVVVGHQRVVDMLHAEGEMTLGQGRHLHERNLASALAGSCVVAEADVPASNIPVR